MRCPSCGKLISSQDKRCIFCNHVIDKNKSNSLDKDIKLYTVSKNNRTKIGKSTDNSGFTSKTDSNKEPKITPKDTKYNFDDIDDDDDIDVSFERYKKPGNTTSKRKTNYKPTYRRKRKVNYSRLILSALIILIILAVITTGIVFIVKAVKKDDTADVTDSSNDFVKSIVNVPFTLETEKGDIPAQKIIVKTKALKVKINDIEKIVVNEKVEFIFNDEDLYFALTDMVINESANIDMEVEYIYEEDTESIIESLQFQVEQPYSPIKLISPDALESEIDTDFFVLEFTTVPYSTIFINDIDESSTLNGVGEFTKMIKIPDDDQTLINIKITSPEYKENSIDIIFRKPEAAFKFFLKDVNPVEAEEDLATINGLVEKTAKLATSLTMEGVPTVTEEEFTLQVKVNYPGYTLCTVTASMPDTEPIAKEIIISKATTPNDYTRTAWAFDYDEILANPKIHNGRHFLINGQITEILSNDGWVVFKMKMSDAQSKIVYVDYFGEFSKTVGETIKIYANRWGNKNDMPRVIAKYIYS